MLASEIADMRLELCWHEYAVLNLRRDEAFVPISLQCSIVDEGSAFEHLRVDNPIGDSDPLEHGGHRIAPVVKKRLLHRSHLHYVIELQVERLFDLRVDLSVGRIRMYRGSSFAIAPQARARAIHSIGIG